MTRTLITTAGALSEEPSGAELARSLKAVEKTGFWLDIEAPDETDLGILESVFGFHHLTIEDIKHRNQRPKLEEYKGCSFVVAFAGAWQRDRLVFFEHHVYLARHYTVTVHTEPAPVLQELRGRIHESPEITKGSPAFLTYLVIDAIVDANFPTLETLDERIDALQVGIVSKPDPKLLSAIYDYKHDVTQLRRYLGAQRDLFQRLITHSLEIHDQDVTLYWRDIHDHILRQYETVDSLRDLLTGATDVYLSTVSNRLNTTMKTLTVVASLFLPLTFLTGFYGMNFAYLTTVLEPPHWAFWVGVGTMLGSLAIQVLLFYRRGWL